MTSNPVAAAFLPFAKPDIGEAEIEAVAQALRSGWLTTGPQAEAFEREFAHGLGDGVHAVAVNSATAGLHLALEALGIGPGDEVIVPTWTFTATAEVVRHLGADPVIVDVDPQTLNIDLARAQAALTERTAAIVPVHFAGLPVDRAALAGFARRNGVAVVEDAAHAHSGVSAGEPIGRGASRAVVFSFYATKTMTTGEGGMVVTADAELAARMRTMRLHGISRDVFDRYRCQGASWEYEVVAPGYKYNLTDPAAAMGRVQLGRAHRMRAARAAIAARYDELFTGLPLRRPVHPRRADDVHAWHLYVVRLASAAPLGRNEFVEALAREHGIGASVHFIPLHRHPYWRDTYRLHPCDFPAAEAQFAAACSLPLSSALTAEEVERVGAAVAALLT